MLAEVRDYPFWMYERSFDVYFILDAGGDSGTSMSGEAIGGAGFDHGPGGNAYTGATGKTHGGDVINNGDSVANTVDPICEFLCCFGSMRANAGRSDSYDCG